MNREKDKDEESEEDAWFESIKEQQAEMLLKQTQRQQDSEASESEDDLGDESQGGFLCTQRTHHGYCSNLSSSPKGES